MRFDDRTSSSWLPGYSFNIPPTKLIHVDIDPEEIARNYPVALGLMADVDVFLDQVSEALGAEESVEIPEARETWLRKIDGWRNEWEEFTAPGYREDTEPMHPQRAAYEIDKALPDDAILISDVGVHHNWLIQCCRPKGPQSLIGSMGFGAMGFGVAGVLGAKLAAPERPCVAVCGDGAFAMHVSAIMTAVEYDIPPSGSSGTTTPSPPSGGFSAAIWMAGNWPPIFRSTPPPRRIIPISPPWPNRRASRACGWTRRPI